MLRIQKDVKVMVIIYRRIKENLQSIYKFHTHQTGQKDGLV